MYYMEHDLELSLARLEILEIGVCNILPNSGNIGKRICLIQSYPGNIGNLIFQFSGNPGNIGNLFFPFSGYPGNIGNLIFADFLDFYKKDARQNFTQNGPIFMPRSLI